MLVFYSLLYEIVLTPAPWTYIPVQQLPVVFGMSSFSELP